MTDTLRKAPYDLDREQELWTFQDAVEHVLDVYEVSRTAGSREFRHAKRAVLEAYRDLPNLHRWNCLRRWAVINTVAEYTTGTIEYDHTGGTSEREVVLTDGTFPTWAEFGQIVIDGVTYDIDQRVDSTHVTLPERMNPGADVDSGTSYTIYRNRYPLPLDYRRNGRIYQASDDYPLIGVSPETVHELVSYDSTTDSDPRLVTVIEDPAYIGGLPSLQFGQPPSEAKAFVLVYERKPRALRTEKYSTGTLSGSTTTLTGSSTEWTAEHKGAVLRTGDTSDEPTSLVGSDFSDGSRYVYQRVVMTVTPDTTLTIDEAPAAAISAGTKYVISDPLDFNYDVMLNAFFRLVEWKFAIFSNDETQDKRQGRFRNALAWAQHADRRLTEPQTAEAVTAMWSPGVGTVSPLG